MKLVKTVKCKLQVNIKQDEVLLETRRRFADACNDVLRVSQENHTTNKVKLQHLCYRIIKEKYGLQANLVIRAIARVAVVYVDPRNTSQRCPKYGFIGKSNRKSHIFHCASCGYVGHADIVAATNIRQGFLNALSDGSPSVGPEAASSCKPLALAMG